MRRRAVIASLALIAAALPLTSTAAQDCPGTPGYVLSIDETVSLGKSFTIGLEAPGNSVAFLIVAAADGQLPTKFGTLCVGMPIITVYAIPIPASGSLVLPHDVPCDPVLDGLIGVFQFVAIGPNQGQYGVSNSQHLTANETGKCIPIGDFYSFTQGGWGQVCNGDNVGCLRDANFADALPGGLVLGDQDGVDGDDRYALVLTSSLAVQNFLPSGGPSAALSADVVNPTTEVGGAVVAQLAAAKLNVAFDDAGAFDALKNQTGVKLGDLVFSDCVNPKLLGMPLRDVIALADDVVSGSVAVPVDVDNDGVGDIGFGDLVTALDVSNNNFDDGTQNDGCLDLP